MNKRKILETVSQFYSSVIDNQSVLFIIGGFGCIVYGVNLYSHAAAWIVAGVFTVLIGFLMLKGEVAK